MSGFHARYDRLLSVVETTAVIVTTAAEGERAGCLVSFNAPCSVQPPRFAVWLSVRNHTCHVARRASSLAVHLLSPTQLPLAQLFGSTSGWSRDKFADCDWVQRGNGVPLLTGTAWLRGHITARMPCGDHTLFVVEPEHVGGTVPPAVLTFHDVRHIVPGNPP